MHVGWAVALRGGGLIAPAIRDADKRPLSELMTAMRDLVERSRRGGLRSSELTSPTVTVTNVGDRGAETVTGIIYPPQVAIVGFGRVSLRPWVVDGRVEARSLVNLSLAADHRVTDGHVGGLFLASIARRLAGARSPMTDPEIRALILQLISDIAPEADIASANDKDDIREAFDLDSMDFLNLVTAIHDRTKINIPESDYNKIFVLKNAVAYIRDALARV